MVSSPPSTTAGLSALSQAIAHHLRATQLYPGLRVDCVEYAGRLLLIGQHRAPEVKAANELLKTLEQVFREVMPTVGLGDSPWADLSAVPVRIYLKLKTVAQPYAMHTFTWRVDDAAPILFPPTAFTGERPQSPQLPQSVDGPADEPLWPDDSVPPTESASQDEMALGSHTLGVTANSLLPNGASLAQPTPDRAAPADEAAAVDPSGLDSSNLDPSGLDSSGLDSSTADPSSLDPSDPESRADDDSALEQAADASQTLSRPFNDGSLALPAVTVQAPTPPLGEVLRGKLALWVRYYWSYGVAALILLASGLFAYALTRPCVVGTCERIDRAEDLYESAQATLITSPSPEDITTAQADLQAAIDTLTPIPTWSAAYGAAQADLQRYQSDLASLNAILQAQATANRAASLSQDPPHPVDRWVDVHLLWQQAIDRLETVPSDSPAFDYAQKKRSEYRENYSAIGRRIVAEEEAEANFNTAIQTGQLAQQRMETANSLAGWQLAAKEWQAAIKGLTLIPRGTMVYSEAQAQLQDYQQQLLRSTNRVTLEDVSVRNYDQAIQAARAAAAYEATGQWTLAVTHWQRAVASAQQIPTDTILADEGAQLLETYQPALTNAQSRLRTAVAIQGLTATLAELCAADATPCTVREDPSQVQVILNSQYAEPLRLAITPPAADGTFAFTNELSPTVQELIKQITAFSHQVDRQVAIYDNRGGFVARYRPDLGGFIKN